MNTYKYMTLFYSRKCEFPFHFTFLKALKIYKTLKKIMQNISF